MQAAQAAAQAVFSEATRHHLGGRLEEAERLYQRVLKNAPAHADTMHLLGLVALQGDRLDHASAMIRQAIKVNAKAPAYHLSLGNVLAAQHRLDEAAGCYRRVIDLDPDSVDALSNLGDMYARQERLDEAVDCYCRALLITPGNSDLHANLGDTLKRARRFDEAAACYARALELDPASPALHNNLGNIHMVQGRFEAALACYQRALEIRPDYPDAHNNRGSTLLALGHGEAAIASFRQALELRPDYPEALNNLGNALKYQQRLDEAACCYQKALDLKSDYPEALYNLGNVLREQERLSDAATWLRRALDLRPDFQEAYINLGNTLEQQRRLDEALACYTEALSRWSDLPDAHFNRAIVLLAQGELARGWEEYEWRWKMPQIMKFGRNFEQPLWRGEPAAGRTLLIHAEQGFGDTIQFCRYAALACDRGLRVILAVQQPLVRLLRSLPAPVRVVDEAEALPDFDLHCPMLSMPLAMRTTLATIPAMQSYLRADEAEVAAWGARLAAADRRGPRIGLVWAGNPRAHSPALAAVDRRRSLNLECLFPLLEIAGLHFISLQKDRSAGPPDHRLTDFMSEMGDFADTAALVANLDLVISVDTSVAHLAASLGKPVWLLERFDSCWRWLTGRQDSPWYPTIRLYRQTRTGDWDTVLTEIARDLRAMRQA